MRELKIDQNFKYIQNKYSKWYFNIIQNALTFNQVRSARGIYVENHHIYPSKLGGLNIVENKVFLTSREHFICHLLLTKMLENNEKRYMIFALKQMTRSNKWHERYIPNSRIYDTVKKMIKEATSESSKERWKNEEYRRNMTTMFKFKSTSPEGRVKRSLAAKESHKSQGFEKMSMRAKKTNKLRWSDESNRQHMSNIMKQSWNKRKTSGTFISKILKNKYKKAIDFSGKNNPACVLCKIISPDGKIFEITEILKFCNENNLLYNYLLNTIKTGVPVPIPTKLYKKSASKRINTVGWQLLSKCRLKHGVQRLAT